MNPKEKGGGRRILKRTLKNKNPVHDTEKDMSRSRTHWRKAYRGYLVDQLSKHGWKWPKTAEGKNTKLLKPELAQIMIDLLGIELINNILFSFYISY